MHPEQLLEANITAGSVVTTAKTVRLVAGPGLLNIHNGLYMVMAAFPVCSDSTAKAYIAPWTRQKCFCD